MSVIWASHFSIACSPAPAEGPCVCCRDEWHLELRSCKGKLATTEQLVRAKETEVEDLRRAYEASDLAWAPVGTTRQALPAGCMSGNAGMPVGCQLI